MAFSVNKWFGGGYLGNKPELRYAQSGTAIAEARLATSKKIQGREETLWHNLVFFNKDAENVVKYAQKGTPLYVECEVRPRSYQDKDGKTQFKTDMVVEKWELF